MRFALSLTALLLGSAAHAEDLLLRADIAEATVYLSGADVTRRGTVSIPAGDHRLLIALPDAAQADRLVVSGPAGLTLGPAEWAGSQTIAEGALDDAEQAAARAAVEAAETALRTAEDDLAAADGAIRALEAQMDYLTALTRGGAEGAAMPADPAALPQLLATLGGETARVQAELQGARIARRDTAEAVTEAQTALRAAAEAFARLRPFGTSVEMVAVPVRAETATDATIALSYLSHDVGWEPGYDLHLDSETGALQIDRFISVTAFGPARWQGVDMTFSTAEPDRRRMPTELFPTPARIIEPVRPEGRIGDGSGMSALESMPQISPPVPVAEATFADGTAMLEMQGLSVRYAYATPVTLGANGTAVLPLDRLALAAETEARAVPRFDETAFLVAMATNETGEPILPGLARFYRDGALVGEEVLPLVAAGAEAEFAFGPIDHLRLVWIDRALAEGDRGLFTTATTQARRIAFGVENTSDAAETVRLVYATPFSEQEDLRLDLSLSPEPTERDVDDRRGVHAWTLEVAPGATELVEMEVEMDWPEGQILTWRP